MQRLIRANLLSALLVSGCLVAIFGCSTTPQDRTSVSDTRTADRVNGSSQNQPKQSTVPTTNEATQTNDESPSITHPELRAKLLELADADQAARERLSELSPEQISQENLNELGPEGMEIIMGIMRVDRKNTARIKQIVHEHGWPTRSMVGEDGAHAAWLLVQHADRAPAFQAKCLDLLKKAVQAGEASGRDLALLTDRVRTSQNKPQVYGTQLEMTDDGTWQPLPIENPESVDQRRASVGLPPLEQYIQRVTEQMEKGERPSGSAPQSDDS